MQQKTIQKSLEDKRLKDFYNLLYNYKYPIFIKKDYYSQEQKKVISSYYYTNGINGLMKNAESFHKSIYMSVCGKYPEYTAKGRARNTENNTSYCNYFVVDLDTKFILNTNLANKIIDIFMLSDFFKSCPKPTAIVKSGAGLHFYYVLKKPVFFGKSQHKDYYKNLYKKAIETTKDSIKKALIELKQTTSDAYIGEKLSFLTFKELKVDDALCGSLNQLIRIPGSYNYEAGEDVSLLFFEENNQYMLGDLVTEYEPRYKSLEYKFQENILPEKEYQKIKKAREQKQKKELQSSMISPIYINQQRLEGVKRLINLRKENGNLIGTRQKIMSQAAWCLVNINYNIKNESEKIDVETELQKIGNVIGGEFSKPQYIKSKIKHIEEYHKDVNKLSNKTIGKWLQLEDEEYEKVPELQETKTAKRRAKKKEKQDKKESAYKLWKGGESQQRIAQKLEISRPTIARWVKQWKEKIIEL